jgi:hypothetical protein
MAAYRGSSSGRGDQDQIVRVPCNKTGPAAEAGRVAPEIGPASHESAASFRRGPGTTGDSGACAARLCAQDQIKVIAQTAPVARLDRIRHIQNKVVFKKESTSYQQDSRIAGASRATCDAKPAAPLHWLMSE